MPGVDGDDKQRRAIRDMDRAYDAAKQRRAEQRRVDQMDWYSIITICSAFIVGFAIGAIALAMIGG